MEGKDWPEELRRLKKLLSHDDSATDEFARIVQRFRARAAAEQDGYLARKFRNLAEELDYYLRLLELSRPLDAEDRKVILLGEAEMILLHVEAGEP